jgi:uncharacterized protein (TIGR02118 family)
MLKFMTVLYRRPDFTADEFRRHLRDIHGPLVERLPGLRRYIQNFAAPDASRKHPGWDAIIEVWWDDYASMQAAWSSPEGAASDADLPRFLDMTRSTWSVVDEEIRR